MSEHGLVELYERICEELSLNSGERRRLWFAVSAQVERIMSQLEDPEHASAEEIEAVCERLAVPPLAELAGAARRAPTWRRKRSPRADKEPWADDPKELLALYWEKISDIVARSARKFRADPEESDTVESRVKEKLFRNDYEIVRNFRREASFTTYLNIIVQRTFADLQVERLGKFHYSALAESLGPLAKELERMIYREGYAPSEAISSMLTSHPETTRSELENLLARLPVKRRRLFKVSVDDVTEGLPSFDPDILMITGARLKLSEEVAAVIRRFVDGLEESDRLLLQLLFESKVKISRMAAMLNRDQKSLYRRRDELFAELREELRKTGIEREDAADLYGYISEDSDFGFGKKEQ